MLKSEKGLVPILLILLAAAGIIIYLTLSSVVSFKNKLFTQLYPKSVSKAAAAPIVFKSPEGQILPVNAVNIPLTQSTDIKIELSSTLGSPQPSPTPTSSPTPTTIESPTPSPTPIPSATPALSVTSAAQDIGTTSPSTQETWTISYKVAESTEELDEAQYEPYTREPTVIDYTFDDVLGTKYIWVEFKDSAGKTDRKVAQIELISEAPTPTPQPSATNTPSSTPKPTVASKPSLTPIPTLKLSPTPSVVPRSTPSPVPTRPVSSSAPASRLLPPVANSSFISSIKEELVDASPSPQPKGVGEKIADLFFAISDNFAEKIAQLLKRLGFPAESSRE